MSNISMNKDARNLAPFMLGVAVFDIMLDTICAVYYNVKHENSHTHNSIGRKLKQVAG